MDFATLRLHDWHERRKRAMTRLEAAILELDRLMMEADELVWPPEADAAASGTPEAASEAITSDRLESLDPA